MQKKYIKNIHLYSVNNKFNKNIIDIQDIDMHISNISDRYGIYKYFYSQNIKDPLEHIFIFNSSILNKELLDFIINFSKILNIWILIDNNFIPIDNLDVKYISNQPLNKYTHKILSNRIVNKRLYEQVNKINKQNQLVYFFQTHDQKIIDKMLPYLYPGSNLSIKLFDNPNFNHPQNLGYLTESDRLGILSESKYYLHDASDYYLTEATICGCIPINLDAGDLVDQLHKAAPVASDPIDIVYYIDFLKDICNE